MFSAAIQEIVDRTGVGPTFSGGGRGQVATLDVEKWGLLLTGKGTSRYAALVDLLEQVRSALLNMEKARIAADLDDEGDDYELTEEEAAGEAALDEAEHARATVEDALSAVMLVFPDVSVSEEDEGRSPQAVWEDHGGSPVLVSLVPCVGECMQGSSDICDCRCLGEVHGVMRLASMGKPTWAGVLSLKPVRFGPKDCACGCGTRTDRRFAPGHDARFHAAQKREAERAALGLSEEEYAEHLKVRARDKAKARRKARRERRAAVVMPSEATDA